MIQHAFCRFVALISAGLVGVSVFAATIQPSGDADQDTSAIRNAIAKGGLVELGEGTFIIGDLAGLTVGAGVTIKGQGWDKTTIIPKSGVNFHRCFKMQGGSRIEGVTITGFKGDYRGVAIYAEKGYISNCRIVNNTLNSVDTSNASGAGISILEGTVDHCIIAHNTIVAGSTGYGAGIGGWGLKGAVTIDTCLICDNENNSPTEKVGSGGGVGFKNFETAIKIINCTIANNRDATEGGVYFEEGKSEASLEMCNCIVTGNTKNGQECNLSNPALANPNISYCLFGLESEKAAYESCLSGNPIFVNPGADDYHLEGGSPALRAGVYYGGGRLDLDGEEFTNPPSMGCYIGAAATSMPAFSPASGTTFETSLSVSITCATPGATIRYTTDGSDPTESSTVYAGPVSVSGSGTKTIKARAFSDGLEPSAIATAVYSYAAAQPPELGAVTVSAWAKMARFSGEIVSVGNNGATACDVYLAYGTTPNGLGKATKIVSGATTGAFEYTLQGLAAKTTYYYTLSISNNAARVLGDANSGSFVTTEASVIQPDPTKTPAQIRDEIQKAIDGAGAGGTVILSRGTFTIDSSLSFTNGAMLVGADGYSRDEIVLKLADSAKCPLIVIYNSPETVISHMTVTAGKDPSGGVAMNSGLVEDCVFRDIVTKNNEATNIASLKWKDASGKDITADIPGGGGVNMIGGTVRGCVFTGCDAQDSGGAGCAGEALYVHGDCLVENCVITNCGSRTGGGGAFWGGAVCVRGQGTVRGCLIADNWNNPWASGVSVVGAIANKGTGKCIVENCTIVNNHANTAGSTACGLAVAPDNGGSLAYNIIIRNNIVWGNEWKDGTEANYNIAKLYDGCIIDCNDSRPLIPRGNGNLAVDPMFADAANGDYHAGFTDCSDAGANQDWMTAAVDLDGNPRIFNGVVDMGCYELAKAGVKMRVSSDDGLGAAKVTLECVSSGTEISAVSWTATRQQDGSKVTASGTPATVELSVGRWDIAVRVVGSDGKVIELTSTGAVDVRAKDIYVNALNKRGRYPYATYEDGTPSIDEAFPLLSPVGTLYVGPGSYVISNSINIVSGSGSRIVSMNGPEVTVVRLADTVGFRSTQDKGTGNRGLQLSSPTAYVSGLTFIAGRANADYAGPEYASTGFAKVNADGAVLTNCVFRDLKCTRTSSGDGGAKGLELTAGTVVDCTFKRIDCYGSAGATAIGGVLLLNGGLADRIIVEECWNESNDTTIPDCFGDVISVQDRGELRNSLVTRCSSTHGAPVYIGVRSGGNPAAGSDSAVVNCTIVANTNTVMKATGLSGGVERSYIHCAGVYVNGGHLVNSIVVDNWVRFVGGVSNVYNTVNLPTDVTYTLVDDRAGDIEFLSPSRRNQTVPHGSRIFHNAETRNYTLTSSSPAVNAGLYYSWMDAALDLAGKQRLRLGVPDLGCYEAADRFYLIIR